MAHHPPHHTKFVKYINVYIDSLSTDQNLISKIELAQDSTKARIKTQNDSTKKAPRIENGATVLEEID